MPNGQAAACKAAPSGFDSHRRLSMNEQEQLEETIPPGQRRTGREPKFGSWSSAFREVGCDEGGVGERG